MIAKTQELACLYVLDELSPNERAAFEARLDNDAPLAALVLELESILEERVRELPQHEAPRALLERVEARIGRRAEPETARAMQAPWAVIARWGIAAVIAVAVSIIAVQNLRRPASPAERPLLIVGLEPHQSTLAELPMTGQPQGADARFIQLASLAEQYWEKPEDLPVKMAPTSQDGRGYALFDPGSNQGFIAIRQLPTAADGKRYHLWVLDTATGQIREAGVIPAADQARGLYFFSVAPDTAANSGRLGFFVTAEDSSAKATDKPRGKVVLGDRTF
jgi:anti-sigma-K factor RskA